MARFSPSGAAVIAMSNDEMRGKDELTAMVRSLVLCSGCPETCHVASFDTQIGDAMDASNVSASSLVAAIPLSHG